MKNLAPVTEDQDIVSREAILSTPASGLNKSQTGEGLSTNTLLEHLGILYRKNIGLLDLLENPVVDLAVYMDQLNLQSDSAANFTLASGAISQWNDLSPAARHATQGTAGNRPSYNSQAPLFDGSSDFLQLATEYEASTFSLYLVLKSNALDTLKVIMGGNTTNNYISFSQGTNRRISVDNSLTASGGKKEYWLYGEEYYTVLSLRRSGASMVAKANGRTLIPITNTGIAGATHKFYFLGKGSAGLNFSGIIKAACISSSYIDEETDKKIVSTLYQKYALPETSSAIVGFGDSITRGITGVTIAQAWLTKLGTALTRPVKNFGIDSTLLSNSTGSANNGQDRYTSQLIEKPYSDTICILYGTNDITNSVSAATFGTALSAVVSGLITKGYTADNIVLGTVPYRQSNALSTTLNDYRTQIQTIATANGTRYADVLQAMRDGGGDTLMADTVHPNDAGHTVIKDTFLAAINA